MNRSDGGRTATTAEWVLAAVGAALTLLTIGFLVYEGVTQPADGAPAIAVEAGAPQAQAGRWAVRIVAHNRGTATAAAVRIVGDLREGDAVVETSELTLDYVPEGSSRSGTLIFSRDPAGRVLDVRPAGYELP